MIDDKKNNLSCPNGHGKMSIKNKRKSIEFRDESLTINIQTSVCSVCKIEVGDLKQTAETQKTISDAYRKKVGLLTSKDIQLLREKTGLTQKQLADRLGIGIASVKRWEAGIIQTRSMDNLLRGLVKGDIQQCNVIIGNTTLALPRIKLVVLAFENILKRKLRKQGDKGLYTAKYLWYADMVSFRELGQSMTGATYAALPYGPQLNNYRELVEDILNADEKEAEPLSMEELMIVNKIAYVFPTNQSVYDAAHKEDIWKNTPTGSIIPYNTAPSLKMV